MTASPPQHRVFRFGSSLQITGRSRLIAEGGQASSDVMTTKPMTAKLMTAPTKTSRRLREAMAHRDMEPPGRGTPDLVRPVTFRGHYQAQDTQAV